VLDIPLYDRGLAAAVQDIVGTCSSAADKRNHCVSATGAHSLVHGKQNSQFAAMLRQFHFNLPDGMSGVWVGRLKVARHLQEATSTTAREMSSAIRRLPK
jgi:N-acetylglucosaminyldiphosphoundecaprenol N-acetyl-beta-D-mannosaminyltransferase